MFRKLIACTLISATVVSCGSNTQKTETAPEPAKAADMPMPKHDSTAAPKADLTAVKLDSDKDPVCGMPVKGYTEDTISYKGKVYGFCAKECKDDFVKNPESFVAKK